VTTVFGLTYYPIKGCAGIGLEYAEVGSTGLAGDRLFAIVGPDGVTSWQGDLPRMATVQTQPQHGGASSC
jgi:uncharacterized protein YcbX